MCPYRWYLLIDAIKDRERWFKIDIGKNQSALIATELCNTRG